MIAENPSIRDYFDNRYYDLLEEAEVFRRELEHSLLRFVERMNRNETIYRQVRYVDDEGREIAKITDGGIDPHRADLSDRPFFQTVRKLPPGEIYASPTGPMMTYAMPVYEASGGEQAPTFQGAVVLDFVYPSADFQRSARFIAVSFFVITVASLVGALLLTGNRVRLLARPIRRLAAAADEIAEGRRDIAVAIDTKDEVGRLAQSFNEMATALEWNEDAPRGLGPEGRRLAANKRSLFQVRSVRRTIHRRTKSRGAGFCQSRARCVHPIPRHQRLWPPQRIVAAIDPERADRALFLGVS
jgi:HAMP domain-containing protein